MKIVIFFACALFVGTATAQQVVIKGTLRCVNKGVVTSTRGAVNIIVIPSFNPAAAVATTTTPQGFFPDQHRVECKRSQGQGRCTLRSYQVQNL